MSISTLIKGCGVVTEGFEDIIKFFQDEEKMIQRKKDQAMKDACELLVSDIKQSMVNTQKRKTDGIARGKKHHYPSLPWSSPAVDFGNLIKSIKYIIFREEDKIIGDVGSFNVDYAMWLEYGHLIKTKAAGVGGAFVLPRPWLKPAIDRNQDKIEQKFKAVISGIY
jgi:hypothetical protein